MNGLGVLFSGFAIVSAVALAITHMAVADEQRQPMSRAMGLLLLGALAGLQVAHFAWLYADRPWIDVLPYRAAQYAVAPAFYLFCLPLLRPQNDAVPRWRQLAHALPVLLFPLLPDAWSLPLVFVVGAGYLAWLVRSLYAMRRERANFGWEIALLGAVFAIAVGVSVLGVWQIALPGKTFYALYAIAIGLAFLLVQIALGRRPQLPAEVAEVAQSAYSSSTLTHVDCAAMLARLDEIMRSDKLYADPQLSLAKLAARLALSAHQLSELTNSRLGKGFSRYLREQRVAAAKVMLCAQPSASVLSVGLDVGFTSQSNFYEAFREIEGTTPGQYRKLRAKAGAD